MAAIWNRFKSKWKDVDFAQLVPERTVTCEEDPETGGYVVLMPRYTGPVWGRILQPRLRGEKRFIRVPLEDRGAFLWRHIDGSRNIDALARLFQETFPEDKEQVHERISTYLYQMSENGFLRLNNPQV